MLIVYNAVGVKYNLRKYLYKFVIWISHSTVMFFLYHKCDLIKLFIRLIYK